MNGIYSNPHWAVRLLVSLVGALIPSAPAMFNLLGADIPWAAFWSGCTITGAAYFIGVFLGAAIVEDNIIKTFFTATGFPGVVFGLSTGTQFGG